MKETFDKIVLNEDRKEQMRANILEKQPAKKTWLAPVIGIAAACAITMIVPFTRTAVVNAAEKIWSAIVSNHNGLIITYTESPETSDEEKISKSVSVDINAENFESFAQEKNGRLFMVLDGKWTDVTDKCGMDKYCRQEVEEKNGGKSILIVGGTPEDHGWLLINKDRKLGNCMLNVKGRPEWVKKALKAEGYADLADTIENDMSDDSENNVNAFSIGGEVSEGQDVAIQVD